MKKYKDSGQQISFYVYFYFLALFTNEIVSI